MMPRSDIIRGQDRLQAHRSVLNYDGDNVPSFKHLGIVYFVPHENSFLQSHLASPGLALVTAHTVLRCLSNPQVNTTSFMAWV